MLLLDEESGAECPPDMSQYAAIDLVFCHSWNPSGNWAIAARTLILRDDLFLAFESTGGLPRCNPLAQATGELPLDVCLLAFELGRPLFKPTRHLGPSSDT